MDQQENDTILLIVVTTGLIIFFAGLVINLLLYARNRKIRHIAEVQELRLNFEKDLLSTRLEVTEATLTEVSSDLHDDVGQMLTVAILELNRLEGAEEARAAVKASLDSIRAISRSLNPDYLRSVGLKDALLKLAERINKQKQLHIDVVWRDDITWQDRNHELYVFRILQELVTNTLKYAHADHVQIVFEHRQNIICISYTDNGKGIGDHSGESGAGVGMLNISRRVQVLHGTIHIETKAGEGFTAIMQFPDSGTMPNLEL